MFGLIAVAFVVLTAQARRSARSIERVNRTIDPPPQVLEQAAMQILRGSNSPASVMGAHSLLETMYGNNTATGTITVVGPVCGGQLIEFTFVPDVPPAGVRTGCVITVTDTRDAYKQWYGLSSRIVGVNPANPNQWQMLAFDCATVPTTGTRVVINGTPFSGTGFGYSTATGNLDATRTVNGVTGPCERALLPNHFAFPRNVGDTGYDLAYPDPAGPGGANSDYTAADFQHMLLAAQMPDLSHPPVQPPEPGRVATIPSFHRSALVRYWVNRTGAGTWTALPVDLLRLIMPRPNAIDHPNFNGSNPNFNPTWDGQRYDAMGFGMGNYSWDVDNDGDAVPDSVWVDLGLPARAAADGRMYKPLFAILCVDLDGRLNLNAHGSLAQSNMGYFGAVTPARGQLAGNPSPPTFTLPQRGQGFGPADVNLLPILNNDCTMYQHLLQGSAPYEGRYGTDNFPGVAGVDALTANKWFEYAGDANGAPDYWWSFLTNLGGYRRDSYGAPPDPFGIGAIGLDIAGRPLHMNGSGGTLVGLPYEVNLGPKVGHGLPSPSVAPDNPLSLSELERVLRPYDKDAMTLPSRLAALAPSLLPAPTGQNQRLNATTESWDIPCPSALTPSSMTALERGQLLNGRVSHVTDLLRARGIPEATWLQLLPPELLAGLKMDLNRPFGNGRADDPGNPAIVDAPATPSAVKQLSLATSGTSTVPVPVSYDGVGTLVNPLLARQMHARSLYVLVFLLADRAYLRSQFGNEENTARAVAQWAANVVDFRDDDSTMTRFDYDPNYAYDDPTGHPLVNATGTDAWNAPTDGSHTVWGCERPELLISETLAFHDRKSEDTDQDSTNKKVADSGTPSDPDYDQIEYPEGSLFVELYNPSGPLDRPTGEFSYDTQTSTWAQRGGVRLDQTTPVATGSHPVWRLLVAIPSGTNDPDDPLAPPPAANLERSVYFANPTAANISGFGQQYYPSAGAAIAPVLPGRYAVIGPGATTYVGRENGGTQGSGTRQIELAPNANPNAPNQVKIVNKDTTGATTDLPSSDIKPPTAVIINQPRRLSVSEPVDGYSEALPADRPVDFNRGDPALVLNNGTTPSYRIVHLQRLANPRKSYNNTPTSPDYNPYVTVDAQPIDLTVFNGNISSATKEPRDFQNNVFLNAGTIMFAARQRGETNVAADRVNNLWKQDVMPKSLAATAQEALGTHRHNFDYELQHSVGWLNTCFGNPRPGTSTTDPTTDPYSYRGDPLDTTGPFPWLTWSNRPFVSPLELMLVPCTRSSQLLRMYNTAQAGTPYSGSISTNVAPFPYLMSFFHSDDLNTTTTPWTDTPGAQFHRILEYLRVPSAFTCTEIQASPTIAAASTDHAFHPPFNRIPTYREPGRVNINTIYNRQVFDGLMNGFPLGANAWMKFVRSRRGYTSANQEDVLASDTTYPTEFARPFRSFGGASLWQPIASLQPDREINGTLLRVDALDAAIPPSRPLFQYESSDSSNDTERNPFFRYQALQRLGNLVTTRSNVYAVWITVGYFEVTPAPAVDPARWPDGYQLGRELGMDTGEVERHRAFYIFDRTLPVGFQRGQDLNVDKAILLRRFIE